jgi:hypothetical protein
MCEFERKVTIKSYLRFKILFQFDVVNKNGDSFKLPDVDVLRKARYDIVRHRMAAVMADVQKWWFDSKTGDDNVKPDFVVDK